MIGVVAWIGLVVGDEATAAAADDGDVPEHGRDKAVGVDAVDAAGPGNGNMVLDQVVGDYVPLLRGSATVRPFGQFSEMLPSNRFRSALEAMQ